MLSNQTIIKNFSLENNTTIYEFENDFKDTVVIEP